MISFDQNENRIDTPATCTSDDKIEIGLHHSELHPYWQDDFDYSAQPKYGEDKFEIPSTYASASNTSVNVNANTTTTTTTLLADHSTTGTSRSTAENSGSGSGSHNDTSTFSSLKDLVIVQSKSSESMSSALQSCAMTA